MAGVEWQYGHKIRNHSKRLATSLELYELNVFRLLLGINEIGPLFTPPLSGENKFYLMLWYLKSMELRQPESIVRAFSGLSLGDLNNSISAFRQIDDTRSQIMAGAIVEIMTPINRWEDNQRASFYIEVRRRKREGQTSEEIFHNLDKLAKRDGADDGLGDKIYIDIGIAYWIVDALVKNSTLKGSSSVLEELGLSDEEIRLRLISMGFDPEKIESV